MPKVTPRTTASFGSKTSSNPGVCLQSPLSLQILRAPSGGHPWALVLTFPFPPQSFPLKSSERFFFFPQGKVFPQKHLVLNFTVKRFPHNFYLHIVSFTISVAFLHYLTCVVLCTETLHVYTVQPQRGGPDSSPLCFPLLQGPARL